MKVLHVFLNGAKNPLWNDFASHCDRSQIELWGASLSSGGDFHRDTHAMGGNSFGLDWNGQRDSLRAVQVLVRRLKREKFAVVHTHNLEASLIGLLAARLARVPLRVMTRHFSTERVLYNSRRAMKLDRFVENRLADVVIALSPAVHEALMKYDGVPQEKIVRVANGVDWNRVQAPANARQIIRAELNLPDEPLICAVGRLTGFKGFETLFAALAQPGLPPNTTLLICGTGPDQNVLENIAVGLGVAHQVRFLGHRRDVFSVMAACDAVVHPSLSEAQSQVVIEAMALGVPLVATDVGAASEAVKPNETGWLIGVQDAVALHAALRDIIENRARAQQIARTGQKWVHQLYPIEKMAREHLELYQRELKKRGLAI